MSATTNKSPLYTAGDMAAITRQIRSRWLCLGIPCLLLLVGVVVSFIFRVEAITTVCTILMGVLLIFFWDLYIKPLCCYRKHLDSVMNGITHEAVLPFVSLSEDVNMVDGVACHALTCMDTDAKGRPYERLFYLDAQKTCPEFSEGETIRVIHHDLLVADVHRA
ncbi:MAG: hypothetical protein IJE07_11360 [Clostridia bacterium]|nr:hypothetical protein [Clostridia bacterium]